MPVLARKPGALRNGAPFKDWVLPSGIDKIRRRLTGVDDGNRQMVSILTAVLHDGLPAVEAACASREHKWAGTVDLFADSKIGRAVWDWKSGKRIYPEYAFQLNAYAHGEFYGLDGDEHPIPEGIEAAYGVHIRADGYDVVPLEFGRAVYDEFLTIRRAFDIKKRSDGDWKRPGSGYVGVSLQLSHNDPGSDS